jgi:Zn-finger nucleic acid-binding protein
MAELGEAEQKIYACGECGGLYADGGELNQLLLHAGLPGLGSLGGRVDPAASPATCRECMIDLTHVQTGPRNDLIYYESCEGCGRVFIEPGPPAAADLKSAHDQLVEFFREFDARRSATK